MKKDEDEQEAFESKAFDIYLQNEIHKSTVHISKKEKTFEHLQKLVSPYFKSSSKLIYFADIFGSIFLNEMDLRGNLFSPLYSTNMK